MILRVLLSLLGSFCFAGVEDGPALGSAYFTRDQRRAAGVILGGAARVFGLGAAGERRVGLGEDC